LRSALSADASECDVDFISAEGIAKDHAAVQSIRRLELAIKVKYGIGLVIDADMRRKFQIRLLRGDVLPSAPVQQHSSNRKFRPSSAFSTLIQRTPSLARS